MYQYYFICQTEIKNSWQERHTQENEPVKILSKSMQKTCLLGLESKMFTEINMPSKIMFFCPNITEGCETLILEKEHNNLRDFYQSRG